MPVQDTQSHFAKWSVRIDVTPHTGCRPIGDYPTPHLDGFDHPMADRTLVERFQRHPTLHAGEVSGVPSPDWLGPHPGR
ncbi:hypothetical protein [Streptomyces sp. NPDC087859]|uniref:hypothetical protein n=1 Tax=Streptomyces sp. NPDC087859 TaxID=3365812 RepID=UPI0038278CF8